ncbi:23S rRNA (uracil(1939)-C(5))-methyltransferase RlmD [Eubacteriales bacterium OttesenSCG-928-N14]|nr:23S rRNA (uracil(1939)-C(5))-methyltransferase RlmD [Eubacteriales bacterium OttesenSCG-928-N14]
MQIPILPNEGFEIEITSMTTEGDGVGRHSGFAIFVEGAITGETVMARIKWVEKRHAVAELVQIIKPSPHRISPPCPYFEPCGGCDVMHLDYDGQLDFKRQRLEDALERIGNIQNVLVPDTIGSEQQLHYRNKAVFSFGNSKDGIVLGYYQKESNEVVPIDSCLLVPDGHQPILAAVHAWARQYEFKAFDRRTGQGLLRSVVLRKASSNKWYVGLVAAFMPHHTTELVQAILAAQPDVACILVNENDSRSSLVLGPKDTLLHGEAHMHEEILGLSFQASIHSFLQVNSKLSETMYQLVLQLCNLTGNELVLDAYCGIGTMTLLFAQQAARVVGVDIEEAAIEDANENARANGITNVEFVCAKAEDAIAQLIALQHPDIVVADPPRAGCKREFLDAVSQAGIARMVYISCNPGTLARDAKILAELGYMLIAVQPLDMFPQTNDIETVALFMRM